MDSLAHQNSPKGVRDALSGPIELINLYDDIIDRISHNRDTELALKALSWVAYASRPLSVTELQYALREPCEEDQVQHDALPDVDIVFSACEGLLVMDQDSKAIRLIRES
jgi:hypothetical protein